MPRLLITSETPGAGKTGVAAAVARHLAYQGKPVTLFRVGSDESAAADAAYYGSLDFVPGSPSTPVDASALPAAGEGIQVVEADSSVDAEKTVFVTRGLADAPESADVVIAADVGLSDAKSAETSAIILTEDRALAGFSLDEVQRLLNAEVLVEGDQVDVTSDHLVIAPIGSDAGQPYLRRFESKTVVVRFDKSDQHLAALATNPDALILTGGRRPSEYLFDAAGARGIPVILSRTDTETTVIALEDIFDHTRFHGERKLNRMAELLEATSIYETLAL